MNLATLEEINAALARREAVIVVTEIATGAARVVRDADAAADRLRRCWRRGFSRASRVWSRPARAKRF